ncbi:hypothetical protein Y032_0130g1540 [Ancylostoma ceylanicum]|uniref:Uncharacterized protein n=1 Tax=Ancylostoma ceylanicum TaxID=53326 RepID=A0A016T7G0_9BILA|nr:hypothetical protein Y032_0130g1540 [Ancylostoma ceylanicum]
MDASSTSQCHDGDHDSAPGPLGCKYDDTLTELQIHLVIPGIREKTFMKASNTQVFLKSDSTSLSCHVEIIKVDKKVKPPCKTIVDRRYYEFLAKCKSLNFMSCQTLYFCEPLLRSIITTHML